jgi:DNA invertase Pin-like site-specific DNA recombinase
VCLSCGFLIRFFLQKRYAIDTSTPSGWLFFIVLAGLVIEKTRAGLQVSRQIGRRQEKITESKIESARKLLASGIAPGDVVKELALSVPTLYMRLPASS